MKSLFSKIEGAVGSAPGNRHVFEHVLIDNMRAINSLAKEVDDEWRTNTISRISDHLTLDDVIEAADLVLLNTADYWSVVEICSDKVLNLVDVRDVMNEFEVQARFLRGFLLFAKRTGAEIQQIQNLLIHISPFLLDAVRVFQIDVPFHMADANWVQEVQAQSPRVDLRVFQSCCTATLISIHYLDQTDNDVLKDFLGSLISLLWHLLCCHRHPRHSDSLKALYKGLRLCRFNLKQRNSNGEFEDQIGVLIRDAGVLICSLYCTDVDPPSLSNLQQRFDVLQPQMPSADNSLQANALVFGGSISMEEISDATIVENQKKGASSRDGGFQEDEVFLLLDRLVRGSKQLRLVPISGMAGIGKTTFALKLFNHSSIIYAFQARAWCTISQVLDKKKVLLQLLNEIQPGDYSRMTEDNLANKFRQSLKQKRYLILLDDVWNPQVLESLRPSFPDDGTQSRIVLTSRLHAIVPHAMHDEQPHFLRLRKESECLKIIEMKLFNKALGLSTELENFAKMCKGLPLTAVIIAGLLATTAQDGWKGILDHLGSGGISGVEQCTIALELSYKQLPGDLKQCFIYFGAFPEDEEIYSKKLIRLWMVEGFVARRSDLLKRIEDVAQEYLDSLIQRNLVMVASKGSTGGVRTCRIHDLLHDYCMMKGKQQKMYHRLLQRHDELLDFNEPYNLERLAIHCDAPHFKESRLFCPLARSMLFFHSSKNYEDSCLSDMSLIIQTFKLLKVLDMDWIWFSVVIPDEIAILTHLTYLSIGCGVPVIPPSIGKLSNLEILIIKLFGNKSGSLPHTIWDLQKLKYLHISRHLGYGDFCLPLKKLENSPSLLELETICGVSLYYDGSLEKQMRKFPNIRRPKCKIVCDEESSEELNMIIVVPEYFHKLEMLTLEASTNNHLHYQFDFGSSAENLRKVTLEWFVLSRDEIAVLGKLANLEVLKLLDISFVRAKMEMEEGEFPELRILVLRDSYQYDYDKLEAWTITSDEILPCLEKLVFDGCEEVKEITCSFLEASSTLVEIEVSNCCSALQRLVRNIEEVQKDFGNSIRVKIYSEGGSESEEEE